MQVRFRKAAETDLRGIIEWYEGIAPEAVPNILSDIYRGIDQLIDYPRSGIAVSDNGLRRLVTRKYHFKIAYQIADDTVFIIGIFRYQNRTF
jgi:plasmid stabilization system protein ParE